MSRIAISRLTGSLPITLLGLSVVLLTGCNSVKFWQTSKNADTPQPVAMTAPVARPAQTPSESKQVAVAPAKAVTQTAKTKPASETRTASSSLIISKKPAPTPTQIVNRTPMVSSSPANVSQGMSPTATTAVPIQSGQLVPGSIVFTGPHRPAVAQRSFGVNSLFSGTAWYIWVFGGMLGLGVFIVAGRALRNPMREAWQSVKGSFQKRGSEADGKLGLQLPKLPPVRHQDTIEDTVLEA
jgi:hypothetical protein